MSNRFILSYGLFFVSLLIQAQTPLVVHEWGTFTCLYGSNGSQLSGLYVDDEPLPEQVYYIKPEMNYGDPGRCKISSHVYYTHDLKFPYLVHREDYERTHCSFANFNKPLTLKNVTVKMETPVLYFYLPDTATSDLPCRVDVKFPRGSITQYYPNRISGEPYRQDISYPQWRDKENYTIDFEQDYNGSIQWEFTILRKQDEPNLTLATEQTVWLAPRKTASNIVSSNYGRSLSNKWITETEKFLFYRGIGNFPSVLRPRFINYNTIELTNTENAHIPFYFVCHVLDSLTVMPIAIGKLPGYGKQRVQIEERMTFEDARLAFIDALQESGLYEDEAISMLETWDRSYFKTDGLKIFWILPKVQTDDLLPIEIVPEPTRLERVIVGRTEILTPEFEKDLMVSSDTQYSKHRYQFAYKERKRELQREGLNSLLLEKPIDGGFFVFPNPVKDVVNVQLHRRPDLLTRPYVTDMLGRRIEVPYTTGINILKLDLSHLSNGNYIIHVLTMDEVLSQRISVVR